MRTLSIALATTVAAALAPTLSARQVGGPAPGSREAMWPAPTEEDWALPCLIEWQRSFEDAVAVARETGKPILICVNMDGEIASEHYAGIRYRREETAALYEPYVTVIASVYRHTPRDFDERGRRVICPRFGSVTCGEHIAIEPGLYDGFFEGQRVAPRHIMVELQEAGGYAESYDVYYAFDTASVFRAIRRGIEERPPVEVPDPVERVGHDRLLSRDNRDRTAIEEAYLAGDRRARRELIEAALARSETFQPGLLRLALYDLDLELNRLAREALAAADSEAAVDLIAEALRVPLEDEENERLISALERLGERSDKARRLAVVHRGLGRGSDTVDTAGWKRATAVDPEHEVRGGLPVLDPKLEYRAAAARMAPDDGAAQLELAEAFLSYGVDPESADLLGQTGAESRKYARLLFEDARRAALRAETQGLDSWRVQAVVALASYYLGDRETGYQRAVRAVEAMPPGAEGWTAMATFALFAEARQTAIDAADREKREWPPEWLADVNDAYGVLANSPYGTAAQVVAHYDFLRRMRAQGRATEVLEDGLERFPDSWDLHARLRMRLIATKGLEGLEKTYAAWLERLDREPSLYWYAGYASVVAAEFYRRSSLPRAAAAAYDRGIALFESYPEAAGLESDRSVDHYVALALAGQARLALEAEDLDGATDLVLESFRRCPSAAATLDGLNLSPVGTAKMLLSRAGEAGRDELSARVQAALDQLDPEMLLLPEFERGGPRARAGR